VSFKVVDVPEAAPDCALEITKRGFAFARHRETSRRHIIKTPTFRSRFANCRNKQPGTLSVLLEGTSLMC
jgi:hypothetical protein